ncbi:hypothetical protein PR202_ga14602 [Eleusine coracana subsp. coracana]|uniref:serine--tRNA ligase n=1 Tax=Eleusine coracana subsp. coracana TaxID=191504 RepID=A0AAV5CH18_ELECO|nr:hypothetical protein PR202_ga14602 [Eleusine coracana subsp. coracana]
MFADARHSVTSRKVHDIMGPLVGLSWVVDWAQQKTPYATGLAEARSGVLVFAKSPLCSTLSSSALLLSRRLAPSPSPSPSGNHEGWTERQRRPGRIGSSALPRPSVQDEAVRAVERQGRLPPLRLRPRRGRASEAASPSFVSAAPTTWDVLGSGAHVENDEMIGRILHFNKSILEGKDMQMYWTIRRRDSMDLDFRFRPERRHSTRGRYSPERDTRGRSFRDDKASSQDRGSSQSRSPIRKRERKHSPDGGKSDSSESFRTSDNEDKKKDKRYPSSDEEITDYEVQLKQVHVDMEALREDKSELEVILEKKTEEVRKLSSKVDNLESQLNEAKEDCQRSQARFERLADLLASDTLKPCNKDQGSIGNANEDQCNAFEMSPSDHQQNHVSTARKRSIALSTSEDAKTGKKKRESDDGMIPIPVPEKYRPEHALEPSNNSNGNGMPKSFSAQKKFGEGDYSEGGNIVSSSNIFTDRELNAASKKIGKLKAANNRDDEAQELIERTAELKRTLAATEAEVRGIKAALDAKLLTIGNMVHESVVVSNDEADNAVVRMWGEGMLRQEESCLKNHVDLCVMTGIVDLKKGALLAGGRGFILTGDGVFFNQALINFGMAFLRRRGFTAMQPPSSMNKETMAKCAQLSQFDEELCKIEGEDKYLIATSEQPLAACHMGERIYPNELPIRYAGYSTCHRKEAGAHGRDTAGIFRVHESQKVEQFCITAPEDSWEMLEEMIKNAEDFYQELGLPYRVVSVISGALNFAAAKKYDLEAWFPASQTYRELVSCSNCTDYQARRLEIRYGQKTDKGPQKFVHMLNSTLTATERTLCCIMENYQTEDGVVVPKALRPYMDGIEFLPFTKTLDGKPITPKSKD